jgi:hypothetical protein
VKGGKEGERWGERRREWEEERNKEGERQGGTAREEVGERRKLEAKRTKKRSNALGKL